MYFITQFISKINMIFILSIIFTLVIIAIYLIVYFISKNIKPNKYYQELAKKEIESYANVDEQDDTSTLEASQELEANCICVDEQDKEFNIEEADSEETADIDNIDTEAVNVDEEENVEAVAEEAIGEAVEEKAEQTTEDVKNDEAIEDASTNIEEESAEENTTMPTEENSDKSSKPKKGRSYNGKYEVFQVADGYAYHLKASNGEILVTSEVYKNRDGVLKAIEAVKRNLETGEIRIFADKRGQFKFKLVSKNYRILAISSNYSVEKSAVRASESFKKFAVKADIVDVELVDKESISATVIEIGEVEEKTEGKYVIEKFDGEYSWALKASNGQILCQADGYTSKAGCNYSIETFKRNVEVGTFKCIKDKYDRYLYKLYTPNGRICVVGESYTTKDGAENAARLVVAYYKNATINEIKN